MKKIKGMKKIIYISGLILLSALVMQSCEKEDPDYPELTWKETTTLSVAPLDSVSTFIVELHFPSGEPNKIATETLNLAFDLDWTTDDNPVSKVTLYIRLQAEIDSVTTSFGTDTEVMLAEITDFDAEGKFNLNLSMDAVYDLFLDDFGNSRDQYDVPILPGDLFEITWKITGKDGTENNAKDECFGMGCQYGILVEGQFPFLWWSGIFEYEWIVLSDDIILYGEIDSGNTGTIEITPVGINDKGEEEYDISHTLFNYYFAAGDSDGKLYFDKSTGLVYIEAAMEEVWNISNVDGPSLDIAFIYEWEDEWGTVTLTRSDGLDWPENIHSPAR